MRVTIATNYDDWEGIYVDGKLKYQTHRITAQDVLEVLGVDFTEAEVDNEWLASGGCLPKHEAELVLV